MHDDENDAKRTNSGQINSISKTRIKWHCSSYFRWPLQPTDIKIILKREEKTQEPKSGALWPLSDRQPAVCGRWLAAWLKAQSSPFCWLLSSNEVKRLAWWKSLERLRGVFGLKDQKLINRTPLSLVKPSTLSILEPFSIISCCSCCSWLGDQGLSSVELSYCNYIAFYSFLVHVSKVSIHIYE
jgi:hypothetical protein